MATDLTKEAAEGFDAGADASCPYLWSSPSSMAWHLGQHLARNNFTRPTLGEGKKSAQRYIVTLGRGDSLNVRGWNDCLLGRYQWRPDNSFKDAI